MGKMDADLVRAPCFQRASEETRNRFSIRPGKTLKGLPVRDGGTATFAYDLLVARMGMPADRRLDRTLRAVRCAPHKSKIAASERSLSLFGELLCESAVCLVGLGNHHQAGGVLVEPVDNTRTLDTPDPRQAGAAVGDQRIDQSAGSVTRGWMDNQSFRLVNDDDCLVLVDDIERDRLALWRGRFGRRQCYGDYIAGFDGCCRIADRARRDLHLAGKDQGLQVRARNSRDTSGKRAIQPGSCLRVGNRDYLGNAIRHGS